MVFVGRPKNWARLWAGIFSDFESLLLLFSQLKDLGCSFVDFAACCVEQQITTIMHCTIGAGITKDIHYKIACSIIFNCAKSFWLYPLEDNETMKVESGVSVFTTMRAKRKLGGFFLLYLLYMKQPFKNRCKIPMDIGNLVEFSKWKQQISGSPYEEEVECILERLHSAQAFGFCVLNEYFGIAALERKILEASMDPKVALTFQRQDVRDVLAISPVMLEVQKEFIKFSNAKMQLFNRMELFCGYSTRPQDSRSCIDNLTPMHADDEYMKSRTIHMLRENKGSEELAAALELIKEETDTPIITVPNLLGDPLEQLIMIAEFKERIRRRIAKLKKLDENGRYIVVKPYLSESGIFGRHMGLYPEEKDESRKRGSNVKSENLWSFMRGEKFGTA